MIWYNDTISSIRFPLVLLFADDTKWSWVIHSLPDTRFICCDLDAMDTWSNEWNISLNEQKCAQFAYFLLLIQKFKHNVNREIFVGQALRLFLITLITHCRQIFVCLLFTGQATHDYLSPTKFSQPTVCTTLLDHPSQPLTIIKILLWSCPATPSGPALSICRLLRSVMPSIQWSSTINMLHINS